MTDESLSRRDYWILRNSRDAAAVLIFMVFPIVQVLATRQLPLFCQIASDFLILMHLFTRFRYFDGSHLRLLLKPSNLAPQTKWMLFLAAGFVLWITLSLVWSPIPKRGVKDVASLIFIVVGFSIFYSDFRKTTIMRFETIFLIGLLGGGLVLFSEVMLWTSFHNLLDDDTYLYDLNRNAMLLAMMVWVPWFFNSLQSFHKVLRILGTGFAFAAILLSESQAAQLVVVVGCAAVLPNLVFSKFKSLAYYGFALGVLITPLLVPYVPVPDAKLAKSANIAHRLSYWKGYTLKIAEKPIVGWGARADRHLGLTGQVAQLAVPLGFENSATSPHNISLEFWVNYGLIGILLVCGFLVSLERWQSTIPPKLARGVFQLTLGWFAYSMVGSSALQGWWVASVGVAFLALTISQSARWTAPKQPAAW